MVEVAGPRALVATGWPALSRRLTRPPARAPPPVAARSTVKVLPDVDRVAFCCTAAPLATTTPVTMAGLSVPSATVRV